LKILVVGDRIEDRYVFGDAERLCPEAPVPVIVPKRKRNSDGGAALVAAQLMCLGADVVTSYGSWSFKERIFAGSHLVCRVDNDSVGLMPVTLDDQAEAIVVSDYGKGAMTRELAHKIIETELPCFVDAKHHWHWYAGRNVTIFPNEHECLDETFMADQVVRKLGKNGCDHFNLYLPATVSEVVDVTGAGDIFMAAFVYACSLQLPAEHCLRFANALAGESCRHIGTYVVPRQFAQAELDRLRVSTKLPGSEFHPSVDSIAAGLAPMHRGGKHWEDAERETNGTLPEYFAGGIKVTLGVSHSPLASQTRPRAPSVPTAPLGAPTPLDPESSDEQDRRLR